MKAVGRAKAQCLGWLVVGAALATGCSMSGLSFVQDRRVAIESPSANERVTLPFLIEWSVQEEFDGYFAVFIDRAPMAPTRDVVSLVPRNDPCRSRDGCPDAEWLADRQIFITADTSVLIERLPDRRSASSSIDRHELAIVLLDESGRRVGEAAFVEEFIVERGR